MSVQPIASPDSPSRERADDSLCADDFEIISDEQRREFEESIRRETEHDSDATMASSSELSTMVSALNLNSLSHLVVPSLMNETIQTGPEEPTTPTANETPVLDGTVVRPDESLVSDLTTPDATLCNMMRSHSETKEILEKTLAQFETLSKDLVNVQSYKDEITSLKSTNESLIQRVGELEGELRTMALEGEKLKSTPGTKDSILEELYQSKIQVDERDGQLNKVQTALAAAHQELRATREAAAREHRNLAIQIDEMHAKLFDERQRRKIAESELNNQNTGNFSMSLVNEQALVNQLREKNQHIESLERDLAHARQELEAYNKKVTERGEEIENLKQVINVLQEDHTDYRRELHDQQIRIGDLEQMAQRMERAEVNNI